MYQGIYKIIIPRLIRITHKSHIHPSTIYTLRKIIWKIMTRNNTWTQRGTVFVFSSERQKCEAGSLRVRDSACVTWTRATSSHKPICPPTPQSAIHSWLLTAAALMRTMRGLGRSAGFTPHLTPVWPQACESSSLKAALPEAWHSLSICAPPHPMHTHTHTHTLPPGRTNTPQRVHPEVSQVNLIQIEN